MMAHPPCGSKCCCAELLADAIARVGFSKLVAVKPVLLQFLGLFWKMSKHSQDEYLKQVTGPGKRWFLLGEHMAAKCVIAAIGIGNSRMARVTKGHVDRRFKVWGFAP